MSNIAYSTVNLIVKEVFASYSRGVEYTKKKLQLKLRKEGIDDDMMQRILEMIAENDPFEKAKAQLENESGRIRFIKDSFPHVEPETVWLSSSENAVKESYQYIPLRSTLKVLLEDETFIQQRLNDPYHHDPDLIQDARDGECYRSNKFFIENPEAVPLILFQDEVEVCNPLGSGKTRHKINCTYLSTMHIQPALRSKVQAVQLVSLVKSKSWKKFGNDACNKRLISDLALLETEGVQVENPVKRIVKAGLQFIIGDNLGQHQIAEMNQVFSSGKICRWCTISYDEACKQGLAYQGCRDGFKPDDWTVEVYDANAEKAKEDGSSVDTLGIKGHCVFNKLQAFHCVLQMPPCIGHDFYEGCFSYDVQFYLDFIINKEKLVGEEQFNENLKNVLLSTRDSSNRPRGFKKRQKNSKFEGNAGSLRVLSRVLSLLLSNVLDSSQVGNLVIKLQEVSELITAPKLTKYEIETVLHFTIIEYLELRQEAIEKFGMSKLRPKHHFLSHYSRLYKFHGPLIHLWAMRMESKHQIIKNCIRTTKNFINPTKTCAVRHQRAQVTYGYNGLFPRKYEVPDNAVLVKDMIKVCSDPFLQMVMSRLSQDALIPKSIKIFGTKYEAGMILVLEKSDFGEMKVGLLRAISFIRETVVFACSVFEAFQSKHCFYITTQKLKDFFMINHSNLGDHQPLQRIGTADKFCFSLHHFVSETQLCQSEAVYQD